MPVPAHRHRETFSHLIGSYSYILYGRVANPLYIDVRLVAHGQVPPARSELEGHEGGVGRQVKLNGSAQEALNQNKDKGCAKPYAADSCKVIALGINFSSEKGTIDGFISSN